MTRGSHWQEDGFKKGVDERTDGISLSVFDTISQKATICIHRTVALDVIGCLDWAKQYANITNTMAAHLL